MREIASHRVTRGVVLLALVAALASSPGLASAAPAKQSPAAAANIAAKKAQVAAAQAELAQMRGDLTNSVAQFVASSRDLDRTRQQIAEVTAQLAEQDSSLSQSRLALRNRAVQLYRGDRVGMLEALLVSNSLSDFIFRTHYLMLISQRDALLLRDVRLGRAESMYLQQSLSDREAQLVQEQATADAERSKITSDIAIQQARAIALGSDIASLMRPSGSWASGGGSSASSQFDPDTVISSANYHAATSMSAADIQAFLDQQPGTLKSYRAKDHKGQMKSAAEMIAEAAVAYNISPKVILVTLQKEQSLLGRTNPDAEAYKWAMGAGKADTFTVYQDAGFGNQIWIGAQKLRSNADLWKPGAALTIEGSVVRPTNDATFAQYRYTPHFGGVVQFWTLYWRYFGDPLG